MNFIKLITRFLIISVISYSICILGSLFSFDSLAPLDLKKYSRNRPQKQVYDSHNNQKTNGNGREYKKNSETKKTSVVDNKLRPENSWPLESDPGKSQSKDNDEKNKNTLNEEKPPKKDNNLDETKGDDRTKETKPDKKQGPSGQKTEKKPILEYERPTGSSKGTNQNAQSSPGENPRQTKKQGDNRVKTEDANTLSSVNRGNKQQNLNDPKDGFWDNVKTGAGKGLGKFLEKSGEKAGDFVGAQIDGAGLPSKLAKVGAGLALDLASNNQGRSNTNADTSNQAVTITESNRTTQAPKTITERTTDMHTTETNPLLHTIGRTENKTETTLPTPTENTDETTTVLTNTNPISINKQSEVDHSSVSTESIASNTNTTTTPTITTLIDNTGSDNKTDAPNTNQTEKLTEVKHDDSASKSSTEPSLTTIADDTDQPETKKFEQEAEADTEITDRDSDDYYSNYTTVSSLLTNSSAVTPIHVTSTSENVSESTSYLDTSIEDREVENHTIATNIKLNNHSISFKEVTNTDADEPVSTTQGPILYDQTSEKTEKVRSATTEAPNLFNINNSERLGVSNKVSTQGPLTEEITSGAEEITIAQVPSRHEFLTQDNNITPQVLTTQRPSPRNVMSTEETIKNDQSGSKIGETQKKLTTEGSVSKIKSSRVSLQKDTTHGLEIGHESPSKIVTFSTMSKTEGSIFIDVGTTKGLLKATTQGLKLEDVSLSKSGGIQRESTTEGAVSVLKSSTVGLQKDITQGQEIGHELSSKIEPFFTESQTECSKFINEGTTKGPLKVTTQGYKDRNESLPKSGGIKNELTTEGPISTDKNSTDVTVRNSISAHKNTKLSTKPTTQGPGQNEDAKENFDSTTLGINSAMTENSAANQSLGPSVDEVRKLKRICYEYYEEKNPDSKDQNEFYEIRLQKPNKRIVIENVQTILDAEEIKRCYEEMGGLRSELENEVEPLSQ